MSCYSILGIPETATAFEIHTAFQQRIGPERTENVFRAYLLALELNAHLMHSFDVPVDAKQYAVEYDLYSNSSNTIKDLSVKAINQ
jgi:hypothetical protein